MPEPTLEQLLKEVQDVRKENASLRSQVRRKRVKRDTPRWLVALILILAIAGAAVGAILFVILNQRTPWVQAAALSSTCTNLRTNTTNVTVGTSGHIILDCGNAPAFTSKTYQLQVYPGISALPTNVTEVWAFYAPAQANATHCNTIIANPLLNHQISGNRNPLNLVPGGYDFCVEYVNVTAAGIGSFNITWSEQSP